MDNSEISAYVEGHKNEPQKVELIVDKNEEKEMHQEIIIQNKIIIKFLIWELLTLKEKPEHYTGKCC